MFRKLRASSRSIRWLGDGAKPPPPDGSETVGAAEFEAWLDRLTGLDHAGRTVS
jgi:hypothetical protein